MQLWAQSGPSHPAERIIEAVMRIYGREFVLRSCCRPAGSLVQLWGNKLSLGVKPVGAAVSDSLDCVYRKNDTFCTIVFELDSRILYWFFTENELVQPQWIINLFSLSTLLGNKRKTEWLLLWVDCSSLGVACLCLTPLSKIMAILSTTAHIKAVNIALNTGQIFSHTAAPLGWQEHFWMGIWPKS